MEQPSIDIFGITIWEPVTMLTDIILAIFCFYFYRRISKAKSTERGKWYFAQFFLWMSINTFLGGVMGHGFLPHFGPAGKYPAMALTIVTMFWLQLASIDLLRGKVSNRILIFCLIKYKVEGTEWVLISLLISSIIPYFQINRIGINQWFTYHDVCHVMMLIGFYVLYLGATKLYKHIEYQNRLYRRLP